MKSVQTNKPSNLKKDKVLKNIKDTDISDSYFDNIYWMFSKKEIEKYSCEICEEVFQLDNSDEVKNLIKSITGCEHKLCVDCLKEFLKSEITENKFPIKCPGSKNKCKYLIPPNLIFEIVEDKLKNKFSEFSFKKYQEELGDKFFGCPTPGCPNGCEFDKSATKFSCKFCFKNYCLKCKCDYHEGKTCDEYKNSKKEKDGDDELLEYAKKEKIKRCPNCKIWVSKIAGCNHMTCIKCKFEFCYVCGEPTKTPNGHTDCKYKFEAVSNPQNNDNKKTNNPQAAANRVNNLENGRIGYITDVVDYMYANFERDNRDTYRYTSSSANNISYSNTQNVAKNITSTNPSYNLKNTILLNTDDKPRKKDGTLDMRYSVNKDSADTNTVSTKTSYSDFNNPSNLPTKKDGTLDMRYSVNKEYSNTKPQRTGVDYVYGNGPTKKDGTLDMRYSVNKEYTGSQYSNNCYSGGSSSYMNSGPTKKDGTLDMRYSVNKSNASSSSSYGGAYQGSSGNGGGYSSGPCKKDGTPDMRYACNKRR